MFIGHEQLVRDFKKLVDHGRLAHGYIFFGPRRVGKATFALSFANFLETGVFDWNGAHRPPLGDLLHVERGAGPTTIGIDDVRMVRDFLLRAPNRSPLRTVVIDGAEFLTTEAENALLKIAEEPSLRALIILVIDDPERLLPTLQSRLQKIHFGSVRESDIVSWLRTAFNVSAKVAQGAARSGHGAPGLAWGMIYDERLKRLFETGRRFIETNDSMRKEFLKELVDDESFVFGEFLDALVVTLFPNTGAARQRPALYHRVLELRRQENSFNLNPRLQLTALARHL